MPVIACPDCGREVSTLAPACPHCGRPSPGGLAAPPAATFASTAKEETLWRGTPSATLLIGKIATLVFSVVGVLVIAYFFAGTTTDADKHASLVAIGWIIAGILFAIQAVMLVIAWMQLRTTMYIVTNQRVIIEQGIVSKTVNEIDLRYVDDSQFFQGLTDRLLGIGNVTLISSDKSSPTSMLRSVRDPRAVRELIRANAYQVSQRQVFTRAT